MIPNDKSLFVTNQFIKDVKKIKNSEIEKEVYDALNELAVAIKENSMSEFFRRKDSKKFISSNGFLKFRATISHRIIFAYGRDIGKSKYSDSIFLMKYVKEHDKQSPISRRLQLPKDRNLLKKEIQYIDREKIVNNIIYKVIPNKFKELLIDNIDLSDVLLNDEQEQALAIKTPLIIKGNSGSGKTLISINLMRQIQLNGESAIYLTFNRELKDKVKAQYKEWGFAIDNKFYTIHQYMILLLGLYDRKYVSEIGFRKWYSNQKIDKLKYNAHDVWSEIRSVIKGYLGINWDMKQREGILRFEDYIEEDKIYSKFNKENEKREIYALAKRYNKYLKDNNLFDENDLSRKIITRINDRKLEKIKQSIIIDEVQDLTDLQIKAIVSLSKNKDIYFCGDQNQIVNPTLFTFSRLTTYLYKIGINTNENIINLKRNYRSNYKIVEYINNIIDIRKRYIGCTKHEDDEKEVAVKKEKAIERIVNINYTKENVIKVGETFLEIPSTAIIVTDEEERTKLEGIYGEGINNIFTIAEIKGLEFNNVVCYNLIKANYETWANIFNMNCKKETKGRFIFNQFYVAVTRAKEHVFVLDEMDDNTIKKEIFNCKEIINVTSENIITNLITAPEEWYVYGKNLENAGHYLRAIEAYKKYVKLTNDSNDIYIKRALAKHNMNEEDFEEASILFEEIGDYENAIYCYERVDNHYKELELSLLLYKENINYEKLLFLIEKVKVDSRLLEVINNSYISPTIKNNNIVNDKVIDKIGEMEGEYIFE